MDIKVISTGKIFHKVDPVVAALFLELLPAAVERVTEKPAVPAPAPLWGVGKDAGDYPHIFYKHGGQVTRFDGHPDKAIDGFKVRRWSGEKQAHVFEGPEPPLDVVEEYRQKCAAAGGARAALPATYYAMARQEPEVIK